MTILQTNHLTEEQTGDIRALDHVCAEADGAVNRISLDNGINAVRDMDSFYLMYDGDALIGVISVFAPTKDVAEISACVHPDYRRKGYFRRLLAQACAAVTQCGYEKLLLVHESSAPAGKAIALKWGLAIEHSEYLLAFQTGAMPVNTTGLTIRPAQEDDLEAMVQLSAETFGETMEDARHMVESTFRDPERVSFVAEAEGTLVGLCGVNRSDAELYLFGLGISPRHQGKGYGRGMLLEVVAEMKRTEDRGIVLEVYSENARAFSLYTTSGFTVRTQYDYYEAYAANYIETTKA